MIALNNRLTRKYNRICKECGSEFIVDRPLDDYGNPIGGDHEGSFPIRCYECKKITSNNKDYWKKQRRSDRNQVNHICVLCGKEYTGRKKKYCDLCSDNGAWRKSKSRIICVMCGLEFEGNKGQKYCSQKCRNEVQRRVARDKSIKRYEESVATGLPRKQNPGAHRDGVICEHYFDVYAYKQGWNVAMPTMDAMAGVDRVIQIEGKWHGVQVKKINSARQIRLYSDKNKLLPTDVDYIAAVDVTDGSVFLYNWNDYKGYKVLTVPML